MAIVVGAAARGELTAPPTHTLQATVANWGWEWPYGALASPQLRVVAHDGDSCWHVHPKGKRAMQLQHCG